MLKTVFLLQLSIVALGVGNALVSQASIRPLESVPIHLSSTHSQRHRAPPRAPKYSGKIQRPMFPGLMGVLLSLSGCTDDWKSAGDECPAINFVPSGAAPYSDSDLKAVVDACRLDRITTWGADGPEYSSSCEEKILAFLPLDTSLKTGTVGKGVKAKKLLARAFYTLLFMPLADTGDFFGSTGEDDYCPAVYQDYLGASSKSALAPFQLTGAAYDSGFSQVNTHLVRLILERTRHFVYVGKTTDGYYARENGGDIELTEAFTELHDPFQLASILVHESRHNSTGFPDGSDHVECLVGESAGTSNCDDSMFGSYGAGFSYVDAVLKGTLLTQAPDGTPLLGVLDAMSMVSLVCTYYQNSINEQSGEIASVFGSGTDCSDLVSDIESFIQARYGVAVSMDAWRE